MKYCCEHEIVYESSRHSWCPLCEAEAEIKRHEKTQEELRAINKVLLEAAKQALADLDPYEWTDLPGTQEFPARHAVVETIRKLRDAISKAEGKP